MGFETLSKPFQSQAAFCLPLVKSYAKQYLLVVSRALILQFVGTPGAEISLPPLKDLNRALQFLYVSLAYCISSSCRIQSLRVLLDFLTQLFFPKDQNKVPSPLPSQKALPLPFTVPRT